MQCSYVNHHYELFDSQGRTGAIAVHIYVPNGSGAYWHDHHPVVILSDLGGDQAFNSVTNDCEFYASQIWQQQLPERSDIIWIEHYPGKHVPGRGYHYKGEETFDQLTFGHRTHAMRLPRGVILDPFHQLGEPEWMPFTRDKVEILIEETFPF